jgi:divalent metal cation (Fe/Co/Zn/Cd) transporter
MFFIFFIFFILYITMPQNVSSLLKNVALAPSFMALTVTGFIILFMLIVLARNFKEISKANSLELISFMCVLSIAIGSHGILHLGLEYVYGYNPLRWF